MANKVLKIVEWGEYTFLEAYRGFPLFILWI